MGEGRDGDYLFCLGNLFKGEISAEFHRCSWVAVSIGGRELEGAQLPGMGRSSACLSNLEKNCYSAHTQNICWCDELLPVRSFTFRLFLPPPHRPQSRLFPAWHFLPLFQNPPNRESPPVAPGGNLPNTRCDCNPLTKPPRWILKCQVVTMETCSTFRNHNVTSGAAGHRQTQPLVWRLQHKLIMLTWPVWIILDLNHYANHTTLSPGS